ncbi:MAG: hypothetical protein V4539_03840 [Bacteroidota bacterium]
MKVNSYKIQTTTATRYEFDSIGPKGVIKKAVEITALKRTNTFNFGFGDLREDGSINDKSETNNDDLLQVLSTVIKIMDEFIDKNPSAILFFQGSTDQRTKVYQYILKRNFEQFDRKFTITGISSGDGIPHEVAYDPYAEEIFLAFLITKKD